MNLWNVPKNSRAFTVAVPLATPTIFLPFNENRWGFWLQSPPLPDTTITVGEGLNSTVDMSFLIAGVQQPLLFTVSQHGQAVRRCWIAFNTVILTVVNVIEILMPTIEDWKEMPYGPTYPKPTRR